MKRESEASAASSFDGLRGGYQRFAVAGVSPEPVLAVTPLRSVQQLWALAGLGLEPKPPSGKSEEEVPLEEASPVSSPGGCIGVHQRFRSAKLGPAAKLPCSAGCVGAERRRALAAVRPAPSRPKGKPEKKVPVGEGSRRVIF